MGDTMPRVDSFVEAGKIIAHLVEAKKKDFLYALWEELVDLTPVDTGKARASWFISGGAPTTKELPSGNYGYPSRPELDRYKRNYTKWYLTNTAPYIKYLNNGHSEQAPAGFVQMAMQKVIIRYG